MYKDIKAVLCERPGLKGRQIAKELGKNKTEVNSYLYSNLDKFEVDDSSCWFNIPADSHALELCGSRWVNVDSFEQSLAEAGCLLSSDAGYFEIILPEGCKPLLESIARILSIANQLHHLGKEVVIDMSECSETKHYLNRIGFFDVLNKNISVKPSRPEISAAKVYQGNNLSVVELGQIDPQNPQFKIPKMLKNSFLSEAGDEKYGDAVFTFFSELFANVCEHSQTPIPGFAALQVYGRGTPRHHIQVIVSDSGKGIVHTLKSVLPEYYPDLNSELDFDDPLSDVTLLKRVMEQGRITRKGTPQDTGRGLGLKRSTDYAPQYNANISVRQETFELKLLYADGIVGERSTTNMPRILGTHICFDFYLD